MRARFHAVHTERAIHVARLFRLEQIQFTSPRAAVAPNAIVSFTRIANLGAADPHLSGRYERTHKMELPDGTDILAKAGATKEPVDKHRGEKVSCHDPGSKPRTVPDAV